MKLYSETLKKIKPVNSEIANKVRLEWLSKMKPANSLGILEEIAITISAITGSVKNTISKKLHLVASADNGVVKEGISSCPTEYTKIVSEAMLSNIAAIGILCDTLDVDFKLIDIGVDGDISHKYKKFYKNKIRYGTNNFVNEPAMSVKECIKAIEIGISTINQNLEYDIFSNGEMGIGNTTTSSAVLYAISHENLDLLVGHGAGIDSTTLIKKKMIIKNAVKKYQLFNSDPIKILSCVGGFDIACIVGFYLGCAANKKPILIDGFISGVAALLAQQIEPNTTDYMIATHKSEEPGTDIINQYLNKTPFLDMNMRLGEGTGAVLSYPIIISALELLKRMKTPKEVYDIFK